MNGIDAEYDWSHEEADDLEERSEALAAYIEAKGLHKILECTIDPMTSEEFGSGVCMYHAYVSVIAHDAAGGGIAFDILHPADDRDACPSGFPKGFEVEWDFDVLETSKRVRRLTSVANAVYAALGIGIEPLLVAEMCPDALMLDE